MLKYYYSINVKVVIRVFYKINSYNLALMIFNFINNDIPKDRHIKIQLGLQVLIINISKFIIIFSIAAVLKVFVQTFIVFSCFAFLRRVIGGLHAKSSFICTMLSTILIIGSAITGSHIKIDSIFIALILLINTLLIIRYAPGDTEKNPIRDIKKIRRLKLESIKRWMFLSIIIIFLNNEIIKNLMLLGSSLSIISLLPIMYQLTNQKRPIDTILNKTIIWRR